MFKFLRNLFKCKKKKSIEDDTKVYKYDDEIFVFYNVETGTIKIEAPVERDLTQQEIVEICKTVYNEM